MDTTMNMNGSGVYNDAIAIANAFRAANDEDTMQVMNTQSSKNQTDLARLKFYVVPAAWMRKAWPVLTAQTVHNSDNWRQDIGRIECKDLLAWENAVASDDDEDGANGNGKTAAFAKIQQKKQQTRKEIMMSELNKQAAVSKPSEKRSQHQHKATLRRELKHEQDFFLLGCNAWFLIKEKFGCEQEIEKECVFDPTSNESPLAVVLHKSESSTLVAADSNALAQPQEQLLEHPVVNIPIPPTGRFRYEQYLDTATNAKLSNNHKNHNRSLDRGTHPGNVSEDDTDPEHGDDLFPGMEDEDRMSTGMEESKGSPLLLMPIDHVDHDDNMDDRHNNRSWLSNGSNGNGGDDMDEGGKTDVDSDAMGTKTVQPRRYGSGLGNLGNTCFMNSSLQCMAHTSPLQKYFLTNEYERDLNRDNPLGTGGELATEFAVLMAEMWGTGSSSQHRSVFPSSSSYSPETSSVVYPRNFKYTLGKHAEQFVGYDQHDCQELASYVLDALHEDTNRVTKKPYVEKPEQGEDESDEEASIKAWQLHLQREDSSVLEHFMGQIKSRVQCSEDGCRRVSTTFDPFMYLSVPIPGSSERTLRVAYVPLDPMQRVKSVSITISKTAAMLELLKKVKGQLEKYGLIDKNNPLPLEDLCPVDVWQKEIYGWYEDTHDIDRIRDNDETFVYQLRPLSEVQAVAADTAKDEDNDATSSIVGLRGKHRSRRYQIDVGTLTRINYESEWTNELSNYLRNHLNFLNVFNPKKGSTQERVTYYQRFVNFIDLCLQEAEVDVAGQKRTREENLDTVMTSPADEELPLLIARSDSSQYFQKVRTRHDVAVLEFLAAKMRMEIMRIEHAKKQAYPNGVLIQIRMRRIGSISMAKDQALAAPFVLRIPSDMTVYGLREEIARRLTRCIKTGHSATSHPSPGQATSERDVVSMAVNGSVGAESASNDLNSFGSPGLLVVRQIPLSFERKSKQTYKSYTASSRQLGSVEKRGGQGYDGSRPISLASATDSDEKDLVAELIGSEGTVFMDWPVELCESSFDSIEYENIEDANSSPEGDEAVAARTRASNTTTVLDCIEKYCAMEQLEETEMWYCNRCKKHVQAWKQFHLFRAPPILIIHLKRFQYSASTHRRDKIGAFIDFPLEGLDLTNQAMHWVGDEKPIYDCYAVTNHFGGLGGGHYTAYALHDDGVWCLYDDSRVTSHVDPKEVVSQAAYVLYYRRRDVSVGHDFLHNIQASAVRPPTIIQDRLDKATETSEVSSSNAAMIDEEDTMEVDGTDVGSRCTSPMGSTGDATEPFVDHEYGTEEGIAEGGVPPLQ